jgi:hypothetical protein
VTARNTRDLSGELVVQVTCADRKGLKTAAEDLSLDSMGTHAVVAECAPGQRVVSGGFEYSYPRNQRVISGGFDTESDREAATAAHSIVSRRAGKRAWEVRAFAEGNPQPLTVYAYCLKQPKKN